MVSQVDHFDTIFVSSEFEALILENSLIKQHQPHYNILLKDDKGYPFVRLSHGPYPRFTLANKTADDGARYFGPFGARGETRAAIDAVCAAFRLPTCTRRFPRDIGKERPCLNHHMGRCDGFCRGEPDAEEYQKRIEQACSLLSGHYKTLARELKTEMEHEAEQLHFEQAAVLRDRIAAIEVLGKRQKVIAGVCADTDVWGLYTGAAKSGCAVVHVEDGSVTGRETSIFTAPTDETEADTLSALLSQYYLPRGVLPREILLPFAVDELSGLETVLTSRAGHRVTLRVPQRGEKAELLAMAERNAREEVERVTTAAEREDKTLRSLAAMCGLSAAPKRMESYDISNTGASDIVASMVVYAGARPLKRDYRHFKMKSVTAHPDDYASMEEVLTRRLQRYADGDEKFAPLPDVFLIDGGMTHAAVAEKVCAAFGLHIPIFGMVKDDRHRTRALTTAEGHEIDLHADPAVFALIGQIQEETHRFAIAYHHESHTRSSVASALDGIPNIGEVRKRKLLARFKSVKAIREAELPALQSELRRAETAEGVSCDLLIDLQGPELRVGALFAPLTLREGDTLTLGEAFPVPPILTGNLQDGDELLLDDGARSLRVLDARAMTCRVERGGVLRSRKSLAVAGRELPASALTEMDMENLSRAREYGVTALMQPFVRGADDLRAVRAVLRETGAQELKIFAKIENMTGLHRLDEILPLADVVVIARGDLGNAMPLWELPRAQTLIARKCRAAKRPFMVSTQMLHSMHHAAVPTRAEVTDVYQAARSGADYLLLTGETAVGEYPVEAMTYFAKIAANGWADAE